MRLLFATSRLPYPPHRGDRVRTHRFLASFSQEHEVTLLSFIAQNREWQYAQEVARHGIAIHLVELPRWRSALSSGLNLWRGLPLQALYYRSSAMQRKLDALLGKERYDAAYVHLFRMAPYFSDRDDLFRILDFTDLVSYELEASLPYQPPLWRAIHHVELPRIVRYEQEIAPRFDEVWFISERDLGIYGGGRPVENAHVVPNGVDTALLEISPRREAVPNLLFVGNLRIRHNIDALTFLAKDILPLVRSVVPACRLRVAGAGGDGALRHIRREPGVELLGFVRDLRPLYAGSAVSVAPLRFAAGIQVKVVEAMAAGVPVVTTGVVNDGLGAIPGEDLLLADTSRAFAEQIVRLLQDRQLAQRIGEAGRQFVKRRFAGAPALERLRIISQGLRA